MTGLLIDTSQSPLILALIERGEPIQAKFLEGRSSTLFPTLKEFCDFQNLSYIAVGRGPGSYIGIRSGATIAKTLSYALKIPLIEFASPLAFLPPKEGTFTIFGDAKMGQLFVMKGDTTPQIGAPKLIAPDELEITTDFFLDLRKPLTPHLELLSKYVYEQFLEGNILAHEELNLTYLR